mgnify:CR=1 FL=1
MGTPSNESPVHFTVYLCWSRHPELHSMYPFLSTFVQNRKLWFVTILRFFCIFQEFYIKSFQFVWNIPYFVILSLSIAFSNILKKCNHPDFFLSQAVFRIFGYPVKLTVATQLIGTICPIDLKTFLTNDGLCSCER